MFTFINSHTDPNNEHRRLISNRIYYVRAPVTSDNSYSLLMSLISVHLEHETLALNSTDNITAMVRRCLRPLCFHILHVRKLRLWKCRPWSEGTWEKRHRSGVRPAEVLGFRDPLQRKGISPVGLVLILTPGAWLSVLPPPPNLCPLLT